MLDAVYFGSLVYFLVGLALTEGDATVGNYFVFMVILFTASWTSGLFFSIFSACVQTINAAQALMAVTVIVLVLFCGFTVQPDVIPAYYIWVYWINYFGWLFRGLIVNEFDSGRYNQLVTIGPGELVTQGEAILIQFGFVDGNDVPYSFEWAAWGILFALGSAVAACILSVVFLSRIRFATGQSLVTDAGSDEQPDTEDNYSQVEIPFKKVDLTFKDIHYTVTASTSDEKLELLKGVDGVVQAGKLTALMGYVCLLVFLSSLAFSLADRRLL
jgi:ABC-2 type transporter